MKSRNVAAAGILVLVLVVAAIGCETRTEYVVGAVLAMSGSGSTYADDIRKGIDLALEELNAAGGIGGLPMRVEFEDSGSNPAQAKAAAEKLMQEPGVAAIIGGVLSSETLAIAPLAQEKRVLLLSPASSSPDITGAGEYIFRIYPSDVVEGTIMADYMLNVLKRSRIVIVAVDNEYGRGLKTVFAKRYRSIPNREIVDVINFPQGTTEWAEYIARIEKAQPDGLYLVGYPQEMLVFLEALRASKASYVTVLASRSFDVEMLKVPVANGVIFPRDPFDPGRTDTARSFSEAYRQKYGSEPSIWAANGYDAVRLLADAIEQSGYGAEKMQQWMHTVSEWDGASGWLTFDRQGDVDKLPVVSIVHDAQFYTFKEYQELTGEGS